jgi:hypothetical protein
MHKVKMKTKHQIKTQSHKKKKENAAANPTFSGQLLRFFFIAGRPNSTDRPPSPVKTQPKKSIIMPQNSFLMPQNSFLMPENSFLDSKTKI